LKGKEKFISQTHTNCHCTAQSAVAGQSFAASTRSEEGKVTTLE